ncbi:MAG: hypothetical protein KC466_00025 [Myxococcales bacterium]|nr:hypothetical protein [Myxococcales bacterium]
MFGQYLIRENLVTLADVESARRQQLRTNQLFGLIASERGFLSRQQVREVIEAQKRWGCLFGEIARELGYLTDAQIQEILGIQMSDHLYIGECLVLLGCIEREVMERALDDYQAKLLTNTEGSPFAARQAV